MPWLGLRLSDVYELHESLVEKAVLFDIALCQVVRDLDEQLFGGHGPVLFIMFLVRLTFELAAFLARLGSLFQGERFIDLSSAEVGAFLSNGDYAAEFSRHQASLLVNLVTLIVATVVKKPPLLTLLNLRRFGLFQLLHPLPLDDGVDDCDHAVVENHEVYHVI